MTSASPHADAPHCPACGYDLFGIDSDRCPECGLAIDRVAFAESRLPWSHRKRIGRLRAFFRTVALATFRPVRLAEEMNRPVSYADARKFRHICIAVAWIPALILPPIGAFFLRGNGAPFSISESVVGCVLLVVAFWLYLLVITGLPSLFFHPPHLSILRQNRAIALSYYSAAPLIGLVLSAILGTAVLLLENLLILHGTQEEFVSVLTILAACVIPPAALIFRVISAIILLRRTTHCSAARCIAMPAILAVGDTALAIALVGGIPLAAYFVAVVWQSLR